MRNAITIILLLLFLASEVLAGFIFDHTECEFIFSQLSEVLLLWIAMRLSKGQKMAIIPIVLNGFLFMASIELIDEIRKCNMQTGWQDYVFFSAGLIGIIVQLIFLYNKKTK